MAAVHAHEPEFHIISGVAGCVRSYSNFYSFKRHVYRKHREHLNITSRHSTAAHSSDIASVVTASDDFDFSDMLECDNFNDTHSDFQHTKNMALFLLKAKEIRKVSQMSLDGLTSDFGNILQRTIKQLKLDINRCLQTSSINMEAIQGLTETFNHPNITNPFRQLESRYQQEKFYKEHLNLLVGIKIYVYYILTIAITTQIVTIIKTHHMYSDYDYQYATCILLRLVKKLCSYNMYGIYYMYMLFKYTQ